MKRETGRPPRAHLMRVKSPSEILETLDEDGKLDGLPFMPEMVAYCGSCIRVHRSARRTCVVGHGFREMKDAVFLQDARCDGSFHDQCHRACLLFWKQEWLTPAGAIPVAQPAPAWSAHDAAAAARLRRLPTRDGERYVCQSTALESATTALHRWDVRPLLREIVARELALSDFVRILFRTLWRRAGGGKQDQLIGVPGAKSRGSLDLRQDEWVAIKPIEELRHNLDEKGRNCGLTFPPTMHHAIGHSYRVAFPVRQIILEQTGMMVKLGNTVALDGLLCEGIDVAMCPRAEFLYCRESWLRRGAAPADRPGANRG
ncbi:hypothetical protein [Massilia sp. Root335]|uniref:hypothetical protein n=1 Tax=Massilia sp. Root335 TaxID=1736517 RepID=UPI000AF1072D|nr:hypothetical protein [Massilia sp. Root335]